MAKRAHKILGLEMKPGDQIRNTDNIGRVTRVGLDYSALSAGNQGKLAHSNKAQRELGQTARP